MMFCVTNRKLCRGYFLERIKQLAAGGGGALIGMTLVPLLSGLLG